MADLFRELDDSDADEPFYLFLGDADREGVVSQLKTSGARYKRKMLDSSVENWRSIFRIFEAENVAGVLMKLPAHSWLTMLHPGRVAQTRQLLGTIKELDHIVFIHQSFFGIEEDPEDEFFFPQRWKRLSDEQEMQAKEILSEFDLNVVPYRTNAEMTVIALEFLDENHRGLVLRLYIPNGRLWGEEAGKVIDLFKDYLRRVKGLKVKQEKYDTPKGSVYELYGSDELPRTDLSREFSDFTDFMNTVSSDPEGAVRLLESNVNLGRQAEEIVSKFAKEAKRLQIDLKQDRERKLLSIRHRLEADLSEVVQDEAEWRLINAAVNEAIPALSGVAETVGLLPSPSSSLTQILNVRPQIIHHVDGVVAQEISGDVILSREARELIDLVEKHGGTRQFELNSDVYQLEDESAKLSDRRAAKGRLLGFLGALGKKAPDMAAGLLQAYIQSKLGF